MGLGSGNNNAFVLTMTVRAYCARRLSLWVSENMYSKRLVGMKDGMQGGIGRMLS
jgi:hypothetical protein